jgi:hypothetical protein
MRLREALLTWIIARGLIVPSILPQKRPTGESKMAAVATAEDVRRLAGSLSDHTIVKILETMPTVHDLEVALAFVRGEGNSVDRLGHELSGTVAQIYDILQQDELFANDEP